MRTLPEAVTRKFELDRPLAEGGFGAVWLATQKSLERQVAIKVLHPGTLADKDSLARFSREAKITAALSDPHIVVLIDHGVDDGIPWIAYEFLPGGSLRERLSRGPIPWQEACRIADQVAQALEAAHQQGILHRDIKPDNILQVSPGLYKVADFGIARWSSAGQTVTQQGVIIGTPAYLSPTQTRGEAPGKDSDIYALGITLFELITGKPPFTSANPMEILERQMMEEAPLVSGLFPEVPRSVDRLVRRMLAKERLERFSSAAELREALGRILADASGDPATWGDRRTVPVALSPRSSPITPGGDATIPVERAGLFARRTWPGWIAGVVITLLVGHSIRGWRSTSSRPSFTFRSPVFSGLRDLEVRIDGTLPEGTRVEVQDREKGKLGELVGSGPDAPLRLGGLPSSSPCRIVARDVHGDLLGTPFEFSTPDPLRIGPVNLIVANDCIQVNLARSRPEPVLVELGTGDPPTWKPVHPVEGPDLFSTTTVSGLEPGAVYWIRVQVPGGWGGMTPVCVRTADLPKKNVDLTIQRIRNEVAGTPTQGRLRLEGLGLQVLNMELAHPRISQALAVLLQQHRDLPVSAIDAVARYAYRCPGRPLIDALLQQDVWSRKQLTPSSRAHTLACALSLGHPRGKTMLEEMLRDPELADLQWTFLSKIVDPGGLLTYEVLDELARGSDPRSARAAGRLMARSYPSRAADRFLAVIAAPSGHNTVALEAAREGLLVLPPAHRDSRLAQLASAEDLDPDLPVLLARSGMADACRLLDRIPSTMSSWLGVAGSLGCARAMKVLEALARGPANRRTLGAIFCLGNYPDPAALIGLLRDPDVRKSEAAAWAAAQASARSAVPALIDLAGSARDRHGVALWALARLQRAEATAKILAGLEIPSTKDPAARVRLGMAAWAAGELRLESAIPMLRGILDHKHMDGFTRACASDSLRWMERGAPTRTFLLLPDCSTIRTGKRMEVGEASILRAVHTWPLREFPWNHEESASTWANIGAVSVDLGPEPGLVLAEEAGELYFNHFSTPFALLPEGGEAPMVRITIDGEG